MFSQESDIIKTMRFIEELKADMLAEAGHMYRAMALCKEDAIRDALAAMVALCYVLGRRLGIHFSELDHAVGKKARDCARTHAALEARFGDFSRVERHFSYKEERNGQ